MDCIFCKIIAGQIPNYTVYEDENCLAFLDVFPHAQGHTVVVPKKHFENIWSMSVEDFQLLSVGLRAAAGRVQARLNPDGMNIGINNAPVAGQAVPHVHWHILPRYTGDGGGSVHSIIKNPGEISVKDLASKFKS
ncbi:MAG: hypothetical protein A3J93_04310 [Candidatus Magasanikbacteria bacterium RIFOXYC2_FULL_42_28]|uniref:HIT domain-containing protein n=1 Tax=Candidatus Magasanikbacteria bacterium RIFOXYC2_FULL_42_28 TaxID=1798704 RepID=A0A1F6NX58_9BACT|nr:MAG: hypothetical protein A3J93_04310 [Candidatus Magasanikbacteria bacterium RIFOXYC2_FULL_42_28]